MASEWDDFDAMRVRDYYRAGGPKYTSECEDIDALRYENMVKTEARHAQKKEEAPPVEQDLPCNVEVAKIPCVE